MLMEMWYSNTDLSRSLKYQINISNMLSSKWPLDPSGPMYEFGGLGETR